MKGLLHVFALSAGASPGATGTETEDGMCFLLYLTVLPAKSDSDVMFCLQSYQGLIIDRSLVY